MRHPLVSAVAAIAIAAAWPGARATGEEPQSVRENVDEAMRFRPKLANAVGSGERCWVEENARCAGKRHRELRVRSGHGVVERESIADRARTRGRSRSASDVNERVSL